MSTSEVFFIMAAVYFARVVSEKVANVLGYVCLVIAIVIQGRGN